MFTAGERRGALIGLVALGCVGAGAAAGLDAGRHIDAFYTTPPAPRWQPATPASAPDADAAVAADYPVAASAPPAWAGKADTDERAFFDTGVHDGWRDEPSRSVRVHRAAVVDDDGPALTASTIPGPVAGDDAVNVPDPVAPDRGSGPDRLP